MLTRVIAIAAIVLGSQAPAWGQTATGVRGIGGGVGVLFALTGPGNLYVDNNGIQGSIFNIGTFESYNFRSAGGQHWSGAMMTLGPQLSVGLIQGANQVGSPIVFPSPPRELPPLPDVESSLLSPTPADFP